MRKIKVILFCCILLSVNNTFCQNTLSHSKIDSIVACINKAKNFLNILDTGQIEQGEIKGRYRNCYIIDTATNELKSFVGSMTLSETHNSTVTAYYFYKSKLIKVEVFDIRQDYKRYNSTYLYYINEPEEKTDVLQSKELKKLKYLRLSAEYLENFKKGMMRK